MEHRFQNRKEERAHVNFYTRGNFNEMKWRKGAGLPEGVLVNIEESETSTQFQIRMLIGSSANQLL